MTTKNRDDNLDELLCALRDEEITTEQITQLEQLVLSDEEARKLYVEVTNMRSSLRWANSNRSKPADDAPSPPASSPVLGLLGESVQQIGGFMPSPRLFTMLTLGVTSAAALLAWVLLVGQQNPQGKRITGPPVIVAKLTRTVDCEWEMPFREVELPKGQVLSLGAGLAEIALNGGARVFIEGPVELELLSEDAVSLIRGRLTAKVTEEAIGFEVVTPGTTVVDLGTEFGVYVEPSKLSTVTVFRGAIDVKLQEDLQPKPVVRKFMAEESVQVDALGRLVKEMGSSDRFIESLPSEMELKTLFKADITIDETTPLEPGFEAFVVSKEGQHDGMPVRRTSATRSFGKIKVTLEGVGTSLFPRNRDPRNDNYLPRDDGFHQSYLLQDLVFAGVGDGVETAGMDILIESLTPSQKYVLTIWSSDVGSEGTRVSDWSANGTPIKNNYAFSYEVFPSSDRDRRFSFLTTADASGKIRIEGRRDTSSYISRFGKQPAVFLNGLQLREVIPPPMEKLSQNHVKTPRVL
ncbi:MAG: FecR domain-containing protein [Planctomycetes bacterium]|nr:FecR domain-containing protein [Planctomycetota bacterium]